MNASDESLMSSANAAQREGGVGGDRSFEGRLLERTLARLGNPAVEFNLWTGERIAPAGVEPVCRVRICSRTTLLAIVADPAVRFPDAYCDGRIEIEGDLVRLLESVYLAGERAPAASPLGRLVGRLHRPHVNTFAGSRANIHHHYDISNAFYELWLGQTMAYTCAYYPSAETCLDQAQIAKMDHVCRKMRLRAGESVVEAGCGWGTLALHMARHYGVKVRAFNISQEQVAYARERAEREGLAGQVEYVHDDYRNIRGRYDAFVSVGMLEHVGVENYEGLGALIARSLGENGRGLIHSIGRNYPAPMQPWIEKRIFPGACPPSLAQMARIFEPHNLSILDVENLRLHYAQTLRHWLERFELAGDRVQQMFDATFVRMWRMYLAGSVAAFTTGTLQLFQVVFATAHNNDLPRTRAHLYVP